MASLKKPLAKPAAKPAAKPGLKPPVRKAETVEDESSAAPAKKKFPAPASGKSKPRVAAVKPTWPAPQDMTPGSYAFKLRSDRWGSIDPRTVTGERIKGRWDNADALRFNMAEYDPTTLMGFAMAMSAVTFASNPAKRLPPSQAFLFIVRAFKIKNTGDIRARFIAIASKSKTDKKLVWYEDLKDPVYRKLRRANRILPSAFVDVQPAPSIRKKKKGADAEGAEGADEE